MQDPYTPFWLASWGLKTHCDRVLQSAAERMVGCVRASDTVCRYGGDEFVILLTEIKRPQDAAFAAEKLHAAFVEPLTIDGHKLHVALSIGISIYPDDDDNVADLMRDADTAMLHAKASGDNRCRFFSADMSRRATGQCARRANSTAR